MAATFSFLWLVEDEDCNTTKSERSSSATHMWNECSPSRSDGASSPLRKRKNCRRAHRNVRQHIAICVTFEFTVQRKKKSPVKCVPPSSGRMNSRKHVVFSFNVFVILSTLAHVDRFFCAEGLLFSRKGFGESFLQNCKKTDADIKETKNKFWNFGCEKRGVRWEKDDLF